MLLDEFAEGRVAGVDELEGREAALVLDTRAGAGFEHHVDEGVAEFAVGLGFVVDPADGAVEGCVAFLAVDGVALKVWLVEEEVDYVVCGRVLELAFCFCMIWGEWCWRKVRVPRGRAYSFLGRQLRGRDDFP